MTKDKTLERLREEEDLLRRGYIHTDWAPQWIQKRLVWIINKRLRKISAQRLVLDRTKKRA